MAARNRFLLLSVIVGIVVCVFLAIAADVTPSMAQTTAPATASAALPQGDPARGQYLVQVADCASCHGAPKLAVNGVVPLAGGRQFKFGQLGTLYAFNLTILQSWTPSDFEKALRQGIQPHTNRVLAPIMPYSVYHNLSDFDIASIAAYLHSLTKVQNDVPAPQLGPAMASLKPLPDVSVPALTMDTSAAYGAYLVSTVGGCAMCHSPRGPNGVPQGRDFAGGTRNFGTQASPLSAPPILGSVLMAEGYDVNNFIATFRTGIRPRGAALNPAMPWHRFGQMTDNDLTAIWNFLQTKKLDSPWPVQTAPATQAATQPPEASTAAATAAK